jgi:SAM-dependent methyltransferase
MKVTGLDAAPAMLLQAQRKSLGLPIRWIEADGRSFSLSERFRLIYLTGNTFQFFLTRRDQEFLLERVRTHLANEGLLAFETRNPRWANQIIWQTAGAAYSPLQAPGEGLFTYLEDSPGELEHRINTDAAGHRVRESVSQRYDHARQILHWTVNRRWSENITERLETTETAVRFTFPQELEALLHYNGFEIGRQYGDWDLSPLSAESPSIIAVCRKRASVGQ